MRQTAHAQRRLCEREAVRCYVRAKWSNNERRANFLMLERHWTNLAESWEYVERLEQFLGKAGSSKDRL
jgi:hypothetical protein